MDIRVSSIPTARGEKLVLRLLSKEAAFVDLEELGLASSDFDTVRANLLRPFGMILITGPTGSGKSTSLYGMLTRLGIERQHALNISTIEDPIEYTMPRVSQMAVNVAAGLEFADGSALLARSDVIIRRFATGDGRHRRAPPSSASFVHASPNDSTGAVARSTWVSSRPVFHSVRGAGAAAQRRICIARRDFDGDATRVAADGHAWIARSACSEVRVPAADDLSGGVRLFRGRAVCGANGFAARGDFEVFQIDDDIRRMIAERR
jgi:general secretion pathway protein E